ncbi:MAG: TolC family protein [Treponema sp.]|jgi:outer membrane protein TolC|nr:TolC family protein [Treponema sp.]
MKRIGMMLIIITPALIGAFGENLTLEQVRSLALANSRSLAKYNLAIKSSILDEKSQTYTNLPSLSLGASASMNLWGERSLQDSLSAGASFSVSQKLWDGGKNRVLKSINAITTEITRKDALAEYYTVLDGADTAYYGALEATTSLEAANAALEAAALGLAIAEARLESGMISYGDYLQALADKEARETGRNQARRDVTLSIAKLKNLTRLQKIPPLAEVNFDDYEELIQKLATLPEAGLDDWYGRLWKTVEANNPGFAKAALMSRRAEESVTLAKKDYLPSLSASVSTGLNYSYTSGMEPPSGRFSLSGSIPMDFWVTGTNVAKKQIARDEAGLDYQNTQDTLAIALQTAILDAIAQASSVVSSRKAFEYAQKHFEYVMELYQLSQNSLSVLSDAASLVSSNHNQLIKAQYGFLLGLSTLRSLGCFEDEAAVIAMLVSIP